MSIYKALLAYQKENLTVSRDAINPHFKSKYATLENINKTVLPALNKHGLVITQHPQMDDTGYVTVTTTITHAESGEAISCEPSCNTEGTAQKVGSAITYLRRYGFALLGVVTDDDDDGNTAQGKDAPKTGTMGKTEVSDDIENKKELQKKILNICMEVSMGDETKAPAVLEELTVWKDKDGKVKRKGLTKGNDLMKLSEAALKVVYGKAKKALDDWQAVHEKDYDMAAMSELEAIKF